MNKIIDSICRAVAENATKTIREVSSGFKPAERLFVIGLGLIGLSFLFAVREEIKKSKNDAKTSS